jgi:transmembrane sensor
VAGDFRTAAGEQRRLALPDGSRLHLNTASAVDMAFAADTRGLVLYKGEILVETAFDPTQLQRPFLVQTNQGRIRALGTRFTVREISNGRGGQTHVTVLDQAVSIRPALVTAETRLEAGQQAHFTRTQQPLARFAPVGEPPWIRGQIIADRQRLGDFIQELARYRPGILRCDPAVAHLRISGVFQISDTDQVLSIVAETLPVRVSRLTDFWVSVGPKR